MRTTLNRMLRTGLYLGLLSLCLLFAPTSAEAGGLGEDEVRTAVETWVRHVTADARPDAVVERMEPYEVDGETVAYIAHLRDGGFCLTGADELVLPVYLYSPEGTYDPENPSYQYVLWEIDTRLKSLRQGVEARAPELEPYQDTLSERARYWQDLIAGRIPAGIEETAPLAEPATMEIVEFTPTWNQDSPYNDQCPDLPTGSGDHTWVGCVATSIAQIMYYWEWPKTGVGSGSVNYNWRTTAAWIDTPLATNPNILPNWCQGCCGFGFLQWTPAGGGRLQMSGDWDESLLGRAWDISADPAYQNALWTLWNNLTGTATAYPANFGAATYDWSVLQDVHADPVDDGDPEAAELSYHAAVAVDMDFGVCGSGAQGPSPSAALEDHFRYDTDALYEDRDTSSADKLIEEIQWLRPFEIGGCRPDPPGGCHSWVGYGYNKTTSQFLMNMGWGGFHDDWYTLDNVDPRPGPPPIPGYVADGHNRRLAPLNVVRFVGATNPGDGSPDDPYEDIEEAIIEAQNGATLIFKAGSDNTFSAGTLTIDRPLTLKGKDATIRKQ